MDAYELADDVKNISNTIEALEWVQKATPLLRQQADRIKDLEKLLEHSVGADCREMRYIQEIENRDARIAELEKEVLMWENAEVPTEVMADLIQELERRGFITTPQIKELSDEEIKKCVIAWVKQIYGNEYVTPSDRHIINGTKLIRLAEKRIFKNDSL